MALQSVGGLTPASPVGESQCWSTVDFVRAKNTFGEAQRSQGFLGGFSYAANTRLKEGD